MTYDDIIINGSPLRYNSAQAIVDWKVDENAVVHFIRHDGSWGGMCSYSDFRKHIFPDLPEIETQTTTSASMGFNSEKALDTK